MVGSSTEVKRVFSMGKNVLCPGGHLLSTQSFEALLFLNCNRWLSGWGFLAQRKTWKSIQRTLASMTC